MSQSTPNKFNLIWDKEKEGDQVVKSDNGKKALLIGPEVAPILEEKVVDYREEAGFSVSINKDS